MSLARGEVGVPRTSAHARSSEPRYTFPVSRQESTRWIRRTFVGLLIAATLPLTACGTDEAETPGLQSPPTPTEKKADLTPGAPNSFSPEVKAPAAPGFGPGEESNFPKGVVEEPDSVVIIDTPVQRPAS